MKRIALLICILFLTASCEIEYDGETRLAVVGKLIDLNGQPVPHKKIDITIIGYGGSFFGSSDLISFGTSDQNGNFTLIFPAPRDKNQISITINDTIDQITEYQSINVNASEKNFKNYKLDLNTRTLYKNKSITTLRLALNQTSTNKTIKDLKIEGKQPIFNVDLINRPQFDDTIINTFYNVIKNQTVILKYTVVDNSNNGATTLESVSIPINNDPVLYIITY